MVNIQPCPFNKVKIYKKLDKFSLYTDGWNGEKSVAPLESAIKSCKSVLKLYESNVNSYSLNPPILDIFPMNTGGINIVVEKGEIELELDILGGNLFSYFIANENFEKEGYVSFSKIPTLFGIFFKLINKKLITN